jgi:hypothetical protein
MIRNIKIFGNIFYPFEISNSVQLGKCTRQIFLMKILIEVYFVLEKLLMS